MDTRDGASKQSREVKKEGGARVDQTETGGAWSRWSQVGPRHSHNSDSQWS